VYNLGVHLISKTKCSPYFQVWTEDQGRRGVQEVGSALRTFLQMSQISGDTLIAWICLWQYLVAKQKFSCIHHKFPKPRHSFLDSDRDFGHVEVAIRCHKKIFSLDQHCNSLLVNRHQYFLVRETRCATSKNYQLSLD